MSKRPLHLVLEVLRWVIVLLGAVGLTLALFLILPLLQVIGAPPDDALQLTSVDAVTPPPPPPPPEEEPEEEETPEEAPPQLEEEALPLDLSQLELALGGGLSGSWLGGDFAMNIGGGTTSSEEVEALFAAADLDQPPRPVHQPAPVLSAEERRRVPGTVYIIFIVDQNGRVENPIVQRSSDPVLDRPALAAVRQWRFEPGRRNGDPVRFRMRVPMTFPKGS